MADFISGPDLVAHDGSHHRTAHREMDGRGNGNGDRGDDHGESHVNPSHYTLVPFDVPGASFTTLTGINDAGQIVGTRPNPNAPAFLGYTVGFIDDKGTVTDVTTPSVGSGIGKEVTPTDINDLGQVSVTSANQYGILSVLFQGDLRVGNLPIADVEGLNDNLDLVGRPYPPASGPGVSYSSDSKTTTPINVPGSTTTVPTDINNRHQIVGSYIDASGNSHGFLFAHDTFKFVDMPGATAARAEAINDKG